jgi:hypothetical protein
MWKSLRFRFPDASAAILMPNHLHLILPVRQGGPVESAKVARSLRGVLGVFSRRFQQRDLWGPIPPPQAIPDRHHLRRQVRYVALNPCRAGLSSDPLEWTWSTYRDLVAASAIPWVDLARLRRDIGEREAGLAVRFHAYVSGDPSVRVVGTAFPSAARAADWPQESLAEIAAASASALQCDRDERLYVGLMRNLFVHLAWKRGWRQSALLGAACGISQRAVQLILKRKIPPAVMSAALFCLGDERLYRRELGKFSLSAKRAPEVSTHRSFFSRKAKSLPLLDQ